MKTIELKNPSASSILPSSGALDADFVQTLREAYQMSPADRACHNAVSNNPIDSLSLNQGVARGDDGHFSHRVLSKGITNQKKSGRCWMFAGLNVLRPQVIRDHQVEDFEFSTAYLQFWDKMEKANLYLESVIELRDSDYLDREWEAVNKFALEDGGWWNYFASLVEKYGVMPQSVMPETHASSHTTTLNEVLGRLVRSRAVSVMNRYADGAGIDQLREEKNKVMAEVYRLLVLHLGEPPVEFVWRRNLRKENRSEELAGFDVSENKKLAAPERHTPQSFYKQYVGRPLSEFVCLYNDPKNELGRHYIFDRARNIVGNECMHFVNIDMPVMKGIAKASILANQPLWFAVNMGFDQSAELGIMKHRLFDYETLFNIDLTMSKADRTRFHSGSSGHAMVIMGVDLDADGQPRKWLIENSWGDDKGKKGSWTLYDDWFDEHVYTIIAHRSHVPSDVLEIFEQDATVLPAWYPGAGNLPPI